MPHLIYLLYLKIISFTYYLSALDKYLNLSEPVSCHRTGDVFLLQESLGLVSEALWMSPVRPQMLHKHICSPEPILQVMLSVMNTWLYHWTRLLGVPLHGTRFS